MPGQTDPTISAIALNLQIYIHTYGVAAYRRSLGLYPVVLMQIFPQLRWPTQECSSHMLHGLQQCHEGATELCYSCKAGLCRE